MTRNVPIHQPRHTMLNKSSFVVKAVLKVNRIVVYVHPVLELAMTITGFTP